MAEPEYNYDQNEFEEVEAPSPERQQNMLDNRLDEKKNYLKHLKTTSKQLAQEIKDINEELDQRVSRLADKQLKKPAPSKLPADPETNRHLQDKYRELNSLRQQIKLIKAKEFNMQFAVDRVKELRGQLKLEQQEIDKISKDYASYKKALAEHPKQATVIDTGDRVPVYTEEISRLKEKIKEISSQRQHQTEQILEIGRKQKQVKHNSMDRSKSTQKKLLSQDSLSNEVAEARRKYEEVGRKLEIMRVRKNILLQEDSHLQDRVKLLQSYQSKYEQLKKVHDNQTKPARKYVMKAEPKNTTIDNVIEEESAADKPIDPVYEKAGDPQEPKPEKQDFTIQQSLPTP